MPGEIAYGEAFEFSIGLIEKQGNLGIFSNGATESAESVGLSITAGNTAGGPPKGFGKISARRVK